MTEFGRVCERRKLRVNVGKSKVMRCTTGYNFRFLMYKTGTARMARQGMEGKICRAPKARGV